MGTPLRQLGRYELVARIGEGGMAQVFLARQRGPQQFEKLVVVKLVHPEVAARPEFATMLLEEARIAALVKHPNCVDVYDLGEDRGTYFIAMEYLEGESLASILRAAREGPRLDPFSIGKIIAECASGLHYAHELRGLDGEPLDLVHQDVTPGNIFVLYTGQVKLVDFGVATIHTGTETATATVRGKAAYLAPELLTGARASRQTDIFALGVVLWEALTLKRLFWSPTEEAIFAKIRTLDVPPPSRLANAVVRDLDDVCLRALARDPAARYPTAQAMRDDLIEILRHASWAGGDGPIARYMQSTFAPRIEARRELLRELSTRRAPRAATLERIQAIYEPAAPPAEAPTPEAIEITTAPSRKGRTWLALGIGAVLVGGAALAITANRGGEPVERASAPADAATTAVAPVDAAMVASAPVDAAVVASAPPDAAPEGVEPAPTTTPPPAIADRHTHRPERVLRPVEPELAVPLATSAKSLYKEGLQDFVAGRTAPALDRFRKAIALDPGYAPAYRGMGMAYERTGDRARAAQAYRKYLGLAGSAADAAQIRERLARLP
ncbi:MAG: protein kinase [Deltaproteobacteria bacterium]|nr:protein kinase [Deltaproteobacteria bacterium]